jgi:hypothetical protein
MLLGMLEMTQKEIYEIIREAVEIEQNFIIIMPVPWNE